MFDDDDDDDDENDSGNWVSGSGTGSGCVRKRLTISGLLTKRRELVTEIGFSAERSQLRILMIV